MLRGEKRHCRMVPIPTIEDAKRSNRERGSLVTEQTRVVNRVKAILTRRGIRSFRSNLRKSEDQLKRTAEGSPLPETHAQSSFISCLRMVREQIRAIEKERLQKLKTNHRRKRGPNAMVDLIARVVAQQFWRGRARFCR
jgi:transposase